MGLTDRAAHKPGEMSGGQQQRVGIARAIVADPTMLLCDEPTGDLDRTTADEILELLQQLNRQHNKTIVMVTHDQRRPTMPAASWIWTRATDRARHGRGMKYFPLVWAAIMRKPARAVLTLVVGDDRLHPVRADHRHERHLRQASKQDAQRRPHLHRSAVRRNRHARRRGRPDRKASRAWPMVGTQISSIGYHQDPKNRVFVHDGG